MPHFELGHLCEGRGLPGQQRLRDIDCRPGLRRGGLLPVLRLRLELPARRVRGGRLHSGLRDEPELREQHLRGPGLQSPLRLRPSLRRQHGSFTTGTLQAAATAHAPGGVTSVRFDLSSGSSVVASATGQVSASDPSLYTASIPLAGILDGSVNLKATLTYGTQTLASAAVALVVDQTAPIISMQSDGRTTLLGVGQSASVSASIGDGAGSGVKASTVALNISGHAAVAGSVTSPGVYGFSVLVDSSVAPAAATTTVPFTITASDNAGNQATLSADPKEVIKVDRDAPQITPIAITTPATPDFVSGTGRAFYGPGAPLTVTATITDGAGINATTVCMRVGTGACVSGTAGASNTFTFSLPRPTAPMDGTTPVDFTITAADSLYASLSGASQAEHIFTTAAQHVYRPSTPASSTAVSTSFRSTPPTHPQVSRELTGSCSWRPTASATRATPAPRA